MFNSITRIIFFRYHNSSDSIPNLSNLSAINNWSDHDYSLSFEKVHEDINNNSTEIFHSTINTDQRLFDKTGNYTAGNFWQSSY